jgi:amicyanin
MKRNKTLLLIAVMVALLAILAGCQTSDENPPMGEAPEVAENTVLIENYKYEPAEITIQAGESVTWINKDAVRHTATGDGFDSGLFGKDKSFTQVFDEAGTFAYICTPHPYMKGTVIVTE